MRNSLRFTTAYTIILKPFKHYQDALFSLFPTIYNEALSLNYPICDLQGCLKRKPNLILAQYGIMAKHFLAAYGHMAARIFHVYCTMYNVVVPHYQAILKCILSREPLPPFRVCVCVCLGPVSQCHGQNDRGLGVTGTRFPVPAVASDFFVDAYGYQSQILNKLPWSPQS